MNTVNLDTDFFSNHKIRELAEQTDGHKKIVTWLKLLCLAGKTDDDGRIYETKGEVLTRDYLASVLGITEDEVGKYLVSFKKLRMIRFDPDKTMRLTNWSKWQVDKGTEKNKEAKRETEKESFPPYNPPYKERDQEKRQETKKECGAISNNITANEDITSNYSATLKEIIDYLNLKTHSKYTYTAYNTVRHINARIREGYTIEEFKKVIDSKWEEWGYTEREQYIRPETLFGSKFEGYLQYANREDNNRSFDVDDAIQAALNRKF